MVDRCPNRPDLVGGPTDPRSARENTYVRAQAGTHTFVLQGDRRGPALDRDPRPLVLGGVASPPAGRITRRPDAATTSSAQPRAVARAADRRSSGWPPANRARLASVPVSAPQGRPTGTVAPIRYLHDRRSADGVADGPRTARTRAADEVVTGCIEAAATYLAAQPAAVQRAMATHTRGPTGRCVGCGNTSPRWPCAIAVSALRALDLLDGRT